VLRRILTDVANELREKGALDEEECFIDATFAMAKGGGALAVCGLASRLGVIVPPPMMPATIQRLRGRQLAWRCT
jgi:hypothetical protein